MTVLVTGVAGFIGSHVAAALLARGETVVGVDNVNPYYDVLLKQARLERLVGQAGFRFETADITDRRAMDALCQAHPRIDRIVHLAAQPGVRHSLVDPYSYVQANVMGHLVILETARSLSSLRHLVYASTSSVYGANANPPFRETDRVDTPMSLYAATKRADELMSYAYGHLFDLPQTGLRFFTVYGPWGRPDMAYFSFARAIMAGEPITLYNGGALRRDFTYIDDIVDGVLGVLDAPPAPGSRPGRVLNIGNQQSESVLNMVRLLERELGCRAVVRSAARPVADVEETFASVEAIEELTGFTPRTPLAAGIPRFVAWFRSWCGS